MNINSSGVSRYTTTAIVFHWVVAILVLAMLGLGLYMTGVPKGSPDRAFYFNLHKSIGVTTALLVIVRLWWRAKNPPPSLPSSMPGWEVQASKISHALLYMCVILMPLSGFAATQFTKYGVNYFGLFKIPPMGSQNKVVYDLLQGIHGVTAALLIVLVIIHVLAVFKHLLIDRDKVFQRMLPGK
ncbi:MAG: cytochrome b [Betaproteobacteria bacterium]|nr:cytochrome b [Betaproteobacteria bacterium]